MTIILLLGSIHLPCANFAQCVIFSALRNFSARGGYLRKFHAGEGLRESAAEILPCPAAFN